MRALAVLLSVVMSLSPVACEPAAPRAAPRSGETDAGRAAAAAVAPAEPVEVVADAAVVPADAGAVPATDAAPAAVAPAPAVDLAPGRWKLGYDTLCVEVFADHTIEIAVNEASDRNPVRIGGRYRAVAAGTDRYRLTIAHARLRQKQLTRCRQSWADMDVPARELLGIEARADRPLTLTLRLLDGGARLEVCGAPRHCKTLERAAPSGRTTALEEER